MEYYLTTFEYYLTTLVFKTLNAFVYTDARACEIAAKRNSARFGFV